MKNDFPELVKGKRSYFPALDGIRFILIILVMGYHIEIKYPADFDSYRIQGLVDGKLAVDVFFVISGFLITYILLSEQERYGKISLKGFYVKRFFRLFPVYLLVIVTYLLLGLLVPGQYEIYERTVRGLPYYFSFRNEFMPAKVCALGHTWSLSIEEKFYFVWPILFLKFRFLRKKQFLLFLGTVALLPFFIANSLYFAYLSILLGCFVAWCLKNQILLGSKALLSWFNGARSGWFLLALTLACYFLVMREPQVVRFGFSAVFALLMIHLILGNSAITRFFSKPICTSMGMRAYGMYLFHMVVVNPVQNFVIKPVGNVSFVCCLFSSYLVLAICTYFLFNYFEKPFTNYGRKLSKKHFIKG